MYLMLMMKMIYSLRSLFSFLFSVQVSGFRFHFFQIGKGYLKEPLATHFSITRFSKLNSYAFQKQYKPPTPSPYRIFPSTSFIPHIHIFPSNSKYSRFELLIL